MSIFGLFLLFQASFAADSFWKTTGFHTKTPNDSCATGIKYGVYEYYKCDGEIRRYDLRTKLYQRVEESEWKSRMDLQYVNDDEYDNPQTNLKIHVPNDSCGVGYMMSGSYYLRCDNGLYVKKPGSKKFASISRNEWNSLLPKKKESASDHSRPEAKGSN